MVFKRGDDNPMGTSDPDPEPSGNVAPEDIRAAAARYPGLPLPLSVSKYMIDQTLEGQMAGPLRAGSSWGGVHLERIGYTVQQLAEAVYHQGKKSITIKLEATSLPWDYDHWEVEIKEVEDDPDHAQEPNPVAGWPCCACEATIQEWDTEARVVLLNKVATWEQPTWGNILKGGRHRAFAMLCGECAKKASDSDPSKVDIRYAIKEDGGKMVRVPIEELEDAQ